MTSTNPQNVGLDDDRRDSVTVTGMDDDRRDSIAVTGIDDKDHHSSLGPRAQAWIRFVNSKQCLILYVILLICNICVFILEIVGKTTFDKIFVVVCEALINAFLAMEVVAGIIIYRLAYFKKCIHVVDFLLTLMCWVFFLLYIEEERPGKGGIVDLEIDSVLLGFRYAFQTLRFVFVFLQGRRKQRIINVEDIRFPPEGEAETVTPQSVAEENVEDSTSRHARLFSKVYAMKHFATDFFTDHTSSSRRTSSMGATEQKIG